MPHSLIREEALEKEFGFNGISTDKTMKKNSRIERETHGSKSNKRKHQGEVGVVPFIKHNVLKITDKTKCKHRTNTST